MTRAGRPGLSRSDAGVAAAGIILVLAFLVASPMGDWGPFHQLWHGRHVLVQAFLWSAFGVAVWLTARARQRGPLRLALIVLIAACCQIPGLLSPPQASSDAYRYVWDGRVQLSGVSPYRYVPLDDHLASLRDPVLFPGLSPQQSSGVRTPDHVPADHAGLRELAKNDPRTRINRPGVPTIYPPVAQAWFTMVAAVTPQSWGTAGLQWAAALLAIGMTALLSVVLRRRHGDPMPAVFWGWSPLVVLETGNNAHIDILAAALILVALLLLDQSRRLAGGVLLGLAVATKILPLLLFPAVTVLRRSQGGGWRNLQTSITAIGTALVTYVPHLLVAGSLVLGYLPGYLSEEGFSSGSDRYALLGLALPTGLRQPVALLLLAVLAGAALWHARQRRPELTAVWLYGGSLLISTPEYPWYCLPLLVMAALANRPEWFAVVLATQWSYLHIHTPQPVGWAYALALVVVVAAAVLRRDHTLRPETPARSQHSGAQRVIL